MKHNHEPIDSYNELSVTMEDILDREEEDEAHTLVVNYRNQIIDVYQLPIEKAVERSTYELGYITGDYPNEKAEKLRKLFDVKHPDFEEDLPEHIKKIHNEQDWETVIAHTLSPEEE